MKRLNIPSVQDVSRIIGPSDSETVDALIKYYDGTAGNFNYSLSQKIARFVFTHQTTQEMYLQACVRERSKAGRAQNAEVLNFVWHAGAVRKSTSYELKPKVFPIRQDIQIKVNPAFYFVENRKANIFWLQPRRRFALNDTQLGLLASIIRMSYLVDDFQEVGLNLLDLSVPEGSTEREMKMFQLDSLPLVSIAETEALLQRFARAYDTVCASGLQRKQPKPKQPDADHDLFSPE